MARRGEFDDFDLYIKRFKKINGKVVRVGILGKDGGDMGVIAVANEYGTDKAGRGNSVTIPERSFLRTTFDDKKNIKKAVTINVAKVFDKKKSINKITDKIGIVMTAKVKEKIQSNIQPKNATSTLAKKGSSRTLVDTGHLRDSIDYEVR